MGKRSRVTPDELGINAQQFELFDLLPDELLKTLPATTIPTRTRHSDDEPLRAALVEALAATDMSRTEIARRLTTLTGVRVTHGMLASWVAPSRKNRIPANVIPAICEITGNCKPLQILAGQCGLFIADPRLVQFAVIGQATIAKELAEHKIKSTYAALRGISVEAR